MNRLLTVNTISNLLVPVVGSSFHMRAARYQRGVSIFVSLRVPLPHARMTPARMDSCAPGGSIIGLARTTSESLDDFKKQSEQHTLQYRQDPHNNNNNLHHDFKTSSYANLPHSFGCVLRGKFSRRESRFSIQPRYCSSSLSFRMLVTFSDLINKRSPH